MSGKGSKQRPVDQKKFDDNWERIFKTSKKKDDFGYLKGKKRD